MGARPPRHRGVPDARDRRGRHACFTRLGQLEDPNFSVPSMTAMVYLAGRLGAADPGRGAQPDGEEVRAARSLREGRHVRAPGLRRHDAQRVGRHLEGGPARGLVSGAQEVQRHQARAARRRHRPDLQRRVRRRGGAAVCGQGRRHRAGRAVRPRGRHQAPPAESADGQEGGHLRQAGQEGLRRVLAPAAGRARHHAAARSRKVCATRTA